MFKKIIFGLILVSHVVSILYSMQPIEATPYQHRTFINSSEKEPKIYYKLNKEYRLIVDAATPRYPLIEIDEIYSLFNHIYNSYRCHWDSTTRFPGSSHGHMPISAMATSMSGQKLFALKGNLLLRYDLNDDKVGHIYRPQPKITNGLLTVAPTQTSLVASVASVLVGNNIINLADNNYTLSKIELPEKNINAISFGADDNQLFIAAKKTKNDHEKIYLWDIATNKAIMSLATQAVTSHLAYNADLHCLATTGPDNDKDTLGHITLQDTRASHEQTTFKALSEPIIHFQLQPGHNSLAVSNPVKTDIHQWDLRFLKRVSQKYETNLHTSFSYTPNGRKLLVSKNKILQAPEIHAFNVVTAAYARLCLRNLPNDFSVDHIQGLAEDKFAVASRKNKGIYIYDQGSIKIISDFQLKTDAEGRRFYEKKSTKNNV